MNSEKMKQIEDFTNIDTLSIKSFLHYNESYLHMKLSSQLVKNIYDIMKPGIDNTNHFLHLISLNKTPFNLNKFEIVKEYSRRLQQKDNNFTNIDFLKPNVDDKTQDKIRKMNTKPNKMTENDKLQIDNLAKIVYDKAASYKGEYKNEIIDILKNQYKNFKINAYIFNYPHALSYHNINLNK